MQGLGQKIPQQGDLEHLTARRRIDEIEGFGRALIVAQQRQQTPRSDMALHLFGGLQGDASPRERRRQQGWPVVDAQDLRARYTGPFVIGNDLMQIDLPTTASGKGYALWQSENIDNK